MSIFPFIVIELPLKKILVFVSFSSSNRLELNLKLWSKYDMYHTVKELEVFFDTVVKEHHLTQAQADHAKRARLTFVKIFKYN